MKKILVTGMLSLSFLLGVGSMGTISPVFAATLSSNRTAHVVTVQSAHMHSQVIYRSQTRLPARKPRQNNQYFFGNSASGDTQTYTGHDQGNSGNSGYNSGYNQENNLNSGNQFIYTGKNSPYWQTNQYFFGNSSSFDYSRYFGYNQGNYGNQGYNQGYNQDNSVNGANQIIN